MPLQQVEQRQNDRQQLEQCDGQQRVQQTEFADEETRAVGCREQPAGPAGGCGVGRDERRQNPADPLDRRRQPEERQEPVGQVHGRPNAQEHQAGSITQRRRPAAGGCGVLRLEPGDPGVQQPVPHDVEMGARVDRRVLTQIVGERLQTGHLVRGDQGAQGAEVGRLGVDQPLHAQRGWDRRGKQCPGRVGETRIEPAGMPGRGGLRDETEQLVDAHTHGGDGRVDRNAEPRRETGCVDLDAAGLAIVDHVQVEDHGDAELGQLQGQEEGAPQVLGITDLDDRIRPRGQDHVPGDFLVLGLGHQAVHARCIDDLIGLTVDPQMAARDFHRGAGVVGDDRILAGDLAEDHRFADIGIADKDDRTSVPAGFGHLVPVAEL